MTHKERFIKTLKCEPVGGQVPTFELVFFLTMEAFGKVHPCHRAYYQWNQMSFNERKLHINEIADIYIDTAKRYGHSAIFVQPNPGDFENTKWLLDTIREKSGDEYYIMMHGDPTWAIPDGDSMFEFSSRMYEEPEKLNGESERRLEQCLDFAKKINAEGCLAGNVNCGLLQTGTDEECRADVLRSLREGMERGYGYIFSTSNCAYTGMPLARYEMMMDLWRQYGSYDRK